MRTIRACRARAADEALRPAGRVRMRPVRMTSGAGEWRVAASAPPPSPTCYLTRCLFNNINAHIHLFKVLADEWERTEAGSAALLARFLCLGVLAILHALVHEVCDMLGIFM